MSDLTDTDVERIRRTDVERIRRMADDRHGGWDGLSPGEALRRLHEAMTKLTQALTEKAER